MVTPIEHAVTEGKARGIPLTLKVLFALALMSAIPLSFAFVLDHKLNADPESQRIFISFLKTTVDIFGYPVHFYTLFVVAIFGASIALAGVYMEQVFVHPVRDLIRWIEAARNTSFEKPPVMPHTSGQEFAELGRHIAAALAYSLSTRSENKNLSNQQRELLTIAAHQLRTPLTGLKWAFQSLISPESDSAARRVRVQQIEATLQRINLIVDNIIASASIEGGTFGYVFSPIDAVKLVDSQLQNFHLMSEEHGVRIIFKHDPDMPPVYIDEYRVATAIFNVIENAIQYTPKGGAVTVTLAKLNDTVEFAVQDTGIGIAEADKAKLFSKFHRGDAAKHMRPDGSGLGLYLVKNVAAAHGSAVSVQSTEGRGTRIAFLLPCRQRG